MSAPAVQSPTPTMGDRLVTLASYLEELENYETPRHRIADIMRAIPGLLGVYGRWVSLTATHLGEMRQQQIRDSREITSLRQMNATLLAILHDEYPDAIPPRPAAGAR